MSDEDSQNYVVYDKLSGYNYGHEGNKKLQKAENIYLNQSKEQLGRNIDDLVKKDQQFRGWNRFAGREKSLIGE